MPKKKADKALKALKKKHGKLKKYVKHLEKQLQDLATPPGPSMSVKKKTADKKKAAPTKTAVKEDNLKQIRGIGAVLEKKLNAAGITSFAQIAKWTDQDIAALPKDLNLGTRPQRDGWAAQAKKLA